MVLSHSICVIGNVDDGYLVTANIHTIESLVTQEKLRNSEDFTLESVSVVDAFQIQVTLKIFEDFENKVAVNDLPSLINKALS